MCSWFKARKEAIRALRDGWQPRALAQVGGVSRQWLWTWWKRFVEGGKHWVALRDRSSRPHKMPTMKRHQYTARILDAKKQHPALGVVKLAIVAGLPLAPSTVHKVLREHDAVETRKKTWKKWRRFQRPHPNYLWQLDITQVPLKDRSWVFIASLVDDCSRFLLASKCFEKELNTGDVLGLVQTTIGQWGRPKQILTDRGTQFTSEQSDAPSLFTLSLDAMGVRHIMGRPRHPRTQGKIERWHRSLKHEWFAYREVQESIDDVHALLSEWLEYYNFTRPHWSLDLRTPGEVHLATLMLDEDIARLVNEVPG